MKTLNLIISLMFVVTAVAAQSQEAEKSDVVAKKAGAFISFEVLDANGKPVVSELVTARLPDEKMERAACCVQPELINFRDAIYSQIESFANASTTLKYVVGFSDYVYVCDKPKFVNSLNESGLFDELQKKYSNGVVLQLNKDGLSKKAINCMSR